ncbi:hypothetical protein [Diaphorobacter sp.]|uniref:hypothetical protein n=1 Tax=Diaphorobacter sp. TaxID=1934310 RepID=UPI003D11677F
MLMTLCTALVKFVQIRESIVASLVVMKLPQTRTTRFLLKIITNMPQAQGQFVGSLLFGRNKKINPEPIAQADPPSAAGLAGSLEIKEIHGCIYHRFYS